MNAEEFYEIFKDNLDFLGVGFNRKEDVTVYMRDGRFYMSYGIAEVGILINFAEIVKGCNEKTD